MGAQRIVVRIEISTLYSADGKFNHQKMDRLAMVLSNLNNSGKQVIVVSSGSIALGMDKLNMAQEPELYIDLQAIAAIGQAELMRFYQRYFDQYNQIVSQVLLTADVKEKPERVINAQNTFNTLLDMNIIPIVNQNDTVSTADIELDDNYPLARNVANITNADIILIKMDKNSKFIIQPRGELKAKLIQDEDQLFVELDKTCKDLETVSINECFFPGSIGEIVLD